MSWSGINIEALNRATQADYDRPINEGIAQGKLPAGTQALYKYQLTPGTTQKQAESAWMQDYYRNSYNQMQAQRPQQPVYGGGGGGGGGGRGGGGGGVNKAALQAKANELFKYDPSILGALRDQANAYNPDIAGITRGAQSNMRGFEDERAQRVHSILGMTAGLAGGVVQANQGAMQTALRDLASRGIDVTPYMQQAQQGQQLATQALSNQTGYMGQLDAMGAQNLQDELGGAELVGQGAQGNLASNRQLLLNQIAQQEADRQQQLAQAKTEFLLKYGIV